MKWLDMLHAKLSAHKGQLRPAPPPPAAWDPPAAVPLGGAAPGPAALAAGLTVPSASNLSCASRELRAVEASAPAVSVGGGGGGGGGGVGTTSVRFSADDVRSLGMQLLAPMDLRRWVSEPPPAAAAPAGWPFAVERHPAAAGPLAASMVQRLRGDMQLHAAKSAAHPKPALLGFSPREAAAVVAAGGGGGAGLAGARDRAEQLLAALRAQVRGRAGVGKGFTL